MVGLPTDVVMTIVIGILVLVFVVLCMIMCIIKIRQTSGAPTPTAPSSTTQRPVETPAAIAMAVPSSTISRVPEDAMAEMMMVVGQVQAVVTGVVPLQDEPLLTVAEQVDFIKGQLRVGDGDIPTVVHQAAEQLGIDTNGRPLIEISRECARTLGARC